MGKQTKAQARASRNKQFRKGISGGLVMHEGLEFLNRVKGYYAGKYEIDSKSRIVKVHYYTDKSKSKTFRMIPERVLIGGYYYSIKCMNIPKPQYAIVDWTSYSRAQGVVKPKQVVISGGLEAKANVGVPVKAPERGYLKKRGVRPKDFMKSKSGRRSH